MWVLGWALAEKVWFLNFILFFEALKWLRELLLKRLLLLEKPSGHWMDLVYKVAPRCSSSTAVKQAWSSPACTGCQNNNSSQEKLRGQQTKVCEKKEGFDVRSLDFVQFCEAIAKWGSRGSYLNSQKALNKGCSQRATKESQLPGGEEVVTSCQSWMQIQLGDSRQGQSRNNCSILFTAFKSWGASRINTNSGIV